MMVIKMEKKFSECIYCNEPWADIICYEDLSKRSGEWIYVSLERDNSLCVEATAGTYEPNYLDAKIKINYCPMCERKLDDGDKDETTNKKDI